MRRIPVPVYVVDMRGSAARRKGDDGPRIWLDDGGDRPDSGALFSQTYLAISDLGADGGQPRHTRRWIALSVLLVAAAIVGGGIAARSHDWSTTVARVLHRDAVPTRAPVPRGAYTPEVIGVAPARPKATIHVGESRDFAISARGPDLRYSWTLDGVPAATGPFWAYAPQPGDVGLKRVEVAVSGREGTESRTWTVRVKPPRGPRIDATPPASTIETNLATPVRLRIDPQPSPTSEKVRAAWQVDGTPAGDGLALTVRPKRPGVTVVRAVVRGDLGGTTTREWRIAVAAPPPPRVQTASRPAEPPVVARTETPASTPPPPVAERTETPPPPPVERTETPPPPPSVARTETPPPPPPMARTETPPPPPPMARTETPPPSPPVARTETPPPSPPVARTETPPPSPPVARTETPRAPAADAEPLPPRIAARAPRVTAPLTDRPAGRTDDQVAADEVRRWLERYTLAWRTHDVDALRRLGQIRTDRDAEAMRAYFDNVSDLDVEVNLIAVRADGDRTIVRFTRRDRFRDPSGRLVEKESPMIEKQLVRTPDGLRLVPSSG